MNLAVVAEGLSARTETGSDELLGEALLRVLNLREEVLGGGSSFHVLINISSKLRAVSEEHTSDLLDFLAFLHYSGAECFVVLHQFLQGGGAIHQIHAELFPLARQFLHGLRNLDPVHRRLS